MPIKSLCKWHLLRASSISTPSFHLNSRSFTGPQNLSRTPTSHLSLPPQKLHTTFLLPKLPASTATIKTYLPISILLCLFKIQIIFVTQMDASAFYFSGIVYSFIHLRNIYWELIMWYFPKTNVLILRTNEATFIVRQVFGWHSKFSMYNNR